MAACAVMRRLVLAAPRGGVAGRWPGRHAGARRKRRRRWSFLRGRGGRGSGRGVARPDRPGPPSRGGRRRLRPRAVRRREGTRRRESSSGRDGPAGRQQSRAQRDRRAGRVRHDGERRDVPRARPPAVPHVRAGFASGGTRAGTSPVLPDLIDPVGSAAAGKSSAGARRCGTRRRRSGGPCSRRFGWSTDGTGTGTGTGTKSRHPG